MEKVAGLDEEETNQVWCDRLPGFGWSSCRTYTDIPVPWCRTAKRPVHKNRCTDIGYEPVYRFTAKSIQVSRLYAQLDGDGCVGEEAGLRRSPREILMLLTYAAGIDPLKVAIHSWLA